ncbi:hydrolase, alpha/beta fold family protein [Pseudooceanicola batsensis HTCC2597]|uniref:Hydrolase, alpha/beta fold family protein n=1 Tax=Pseudooceanicola batsensis (strain ATCC BAA-863 / DSM 15984 / KCTC 12145 / HTCC2597) TaxID=252305 RepID=A3TX14_PSEBH|nr:alpha/beta hydrolase [Pseudooceanicola batsensis]EAQ03374.1 hydrolase, alpha/beta fold family protein [Pseudooceanicola batsensis HTCC2597]
MEQAPFFADIAEGPPGGRAVWTTASDGVRIRVGWWPARDGGTAKGTILIFPGRTEYIEKYGRDARTLTEAGFAVLAIDWRGQGIADRLVANARVGHVDRFHDYQLDVAAALAVAEEAGLPRPWHLLGHSMGGCIGLRSVLEGVPVNSAVFSAPMWGIRLAAPTRPAAWVLTWGGSRLGLGHLMSPGTKEAPYPLDVAFGENKLTSDRDMFDYMRRQLTEQPDLGLGGPSLHWLNQALTETLALARRPAPDLPCLTFLGADEAIVDPARIHARMENWREGDLVVLPGARHEVLMETPETRARIFERMLPFLDAHAAIAAPPARSA